MKIKAVSIKTFGGLTNYYGDFSGENITLVYGENEAGKTTVTEFIRGTLFPDRSFRYPAQKKTDSGFVRVEMDNGETRELIRDGRRIYEKDSRSLPADDLKMDSDTYRSLFSLDIEQISDDRMITNGDFRRKFLTVPGGEHVPEVSESIKNSMSLLSSKEKLTDSRELGRLRKKYKEAEDRIAECNERTDGYNDLVARREKLGRDLDNARMLQDRDAYEKNKAFMFESMKANTAKLEELRARREQIAYADALDDDDIRLYDDLRTRLVTLDGLIESGAADDSEDNDLTAEEVRSIMAMSKEIDAVWSSRARMEILEGAIEDISKSIEMDSESISSVANSLRLPEANIEKMATNKEVREVLRNPDHRKTISKKTVSWFSTRKRAVYSAIGLGAAVGSFAMGYPWAVIPLVTIVFIVNILPSIFHGFCRVDDINWPVWLEANGFSGMTTEQEASDAFAKVEPIAYQIERRAMSRQRLDAFQKEMNTLTSNARAVTSKMKIGTGSVFRDMNEMYRMYSKSKEISEAFSESDGLSEKRASVAKELDSLVSKYGSESEFVEMRIVKDELKSLDIRIRELESALQSAQELSSDVMRKTLDDNLPDTEEKVDPAKMIEEINMQIGEVTAEMRHIVNDDELSDRLIEKGSIEKDFNTALRQWAVYAIADHMIGDCCDRFYSELQPTVIKTADRYLDLMTNGRYRLGSDPRDSTLFIEDVRRESKHVSEWSSGLSDQVFLSVKMAIAKEMGTEKIPIIIDDVLVRFDSKRKQGACRAIMEFAQDQQVIMFTCDNTLISMLRMEGPVNYVELH